MVVVRAYLDESYSKEKGGAMTLAGWVATPECWNEFNIRWRELLDSAPHPISEFKTSNLANGKGEFSDWTVEEREDYLLRAALIFESGEKGLREIGAFGFTFFHELSPPEKWDRPHKQDLCWMMAWHAIFHLPFEVFRPTKWNTGQMRIDYVFDRRDSICDEVNKTFDKVKEHVASKMDPQIRRMIGSLNFGVSDVVLPLQAADFLAWERRRRTVDRKNGLPFRAEYIWLLASRRPWNFRIVDENFLPVVEKYWKAVDAGISTPSLLEQLPYEPD